MPIQLICMANSWREHGRCLAGISQTTGDWLRPVSSEGGPIRNDDTMIRGRYIEPLDIVEMWLLRPSGKTRFQKENCEISNWNWKLVGRLAPKDVLRYCSPLPRVLHSNSKVVEPAEMERLPPEQWVSLQLVHSENVVFQRDEHKKDRWLAKFHPRNSSRRYQVGLTDPIATKRLERGEQIGHECLLTLSLTEPTAFPNWDIPELCYKVVAAVIELP